MRSVIVTLLLFILAVPSSLPKEDDAVFVLQYRTNGNKEEILSKIKALETEVSRIERESAEIPTEELTKASQWIEDVKKSFNSGSPEHTRIILKKASYQVEFLNALLEESRSKKEVDEMKELLQKIRNQTEEIKTVNAELIEEINRLEQK